MLPVTVAIVSTARRCAMPISELPTSGEITRPGESNLVIMNGWPTGTPRTGSNRTAQRLKKDELCLEMK
jgi:hypothetical protein